MEEYLALKQEHQALMAKADELGRADDKSVKVWGYSDETRAAENAARACHNKLISMYNKLSRTIPDLPWP